MRWLLVIVVLCTQLSAQVVVSGKNTANGSVTLSSTIQSTPLLPDSTLLNWNTSLAATPASGPTVCVGTPVNASLLPGGSCSSSFPGTTAGLKSALSGMACGQIINIQNISYLGDFRIPNGVICSVSNWVWITHDLSDTTFPVEGNRIDPCYMGIAPTTIPYYVYPTWDTCASPNRHMPQFVAIASNAQPALFLNVPTVGTNTPSAAYIRIMGIEFTRDQSFDLVTSLVDFNYQPNSLGQDCAPNNVLNATAINNGGTGYTVGDVLNVIQGGAVGGQIKVVTVTSGVINTYTILNFGSGYSVAGGLTTSGGTGTGATINITSINGPNALPVNAVACMTDQPNHIILDRVIVHGDAQRQTNRAIALAGASWVATLDSYIYDIQVSYAGGAGDAQSWAWGTGQGYSNVGEGKFVNNYVMASTETSALLCGATTMPVLAATGFDSIPYSFLFDQDFFSKNPLMDSQIGQTLNEVIPIEGHNYGPAPDQELDVAPTSVQLQTNQTYQFQLTWLNDSNGGLNRVSPALGVPTLSCGVGSCGSITAIGEHNVGSSAWLSANQITWVYTTPASPPSANVTITFTTTTADDRLATLGHSRTLTAIATVTIVSGTPTSLISLSPASATLSIQPSYSDGHNNLRQFCTVFFAIPNYSAGTLTWSISINHSGGTISSSLTGLAANSAAYCSGPSTGVDTIQVTDGTITNSTTITVANSAPILGYDLKPFPSKNGFELKCGTRGLVQHFIVELVWGSAGNGGGQPGNAILCQSLNQANQLSDGFGHNVGYGPEHINDITIKYGHFIHTGVGIVVAALNGALGTRRSAYSNLEFEDLNMTRWGHGFLSTNFNSFLQYSGTAGTSVLPWTSVGNPLAGYTTLNHITSVGGTPTNPGTGNFLSINNNNAQFQLWPFSITNSIVVANGSNTFSNNFGDANDCNTASGTGSLNTEIKALQGTGYIPPKPCNSTYSLARNALVDNTALSANFVTSTIWQPLDSDTTLFPSYNSGTGGNYCPPGGSQYAAGGARDASDGLALGVDCTGLAASDLSVRTGTRTP